uniref:hypothetical protein n=1 Tax=Prevotella sp. TaxID=59823 RepID=UPI004024BA0D
GVGGVAVVACLLVMSDKALCGINRLRAICPRFSCHDNGDAASCESRANPFHTRPVTGLVNGVSGE